MVCISNVGNKYIIANELTFGVTPNPFTAVDWGHIQKINVKEEENVEKMSSLNSGHLSSTFEDGLYWTNVSIETKISKEALPNILEFVMGTVSDDGTDYTAVTSTTTNSVSMKFYYHDSKIGLLSGMVCKDFEISASKGETVSISMNCIAQKLEESIETLSVSTNVSSIFSWLDCSVSVGGNNEVLNNFSLSGNWNVTDNEGRGIESMSVGERRLINCVLKHRLDLSGNYESEVNDTQEFGYNEERSDEALVFSISRGNDNAHIFTLSKTRSASRNIDMSADNTKKVIGYDFEAIDFIVNGDL